MAQAAQSDKRLFRNPFVFSAQMATMSDGTEINGGALVQGERQPFPLDPFSNALSRPFIVKRIKFCVWRVAGGDEIDSDYSNVATIVRNLVTNEDLMKDPAQLSSLLDKERREWIFHPGELILRANGGGLKIDMLVNQGALGAPYNMEVSVHGYTEERAEVPQGMYPEER